MTNNPHFPNMSAEFLAEIAKLAAGIEALQNAYNEAADRSKTKIAARNAAYVVVVAILKRIAKFAELAADGDEVALRSTGFAIAKGKGSNAVDMAILDSPLVRMAHGKLSGVLIAMAAAIPGAVSYELLLAESDPTRPENFVQYGIFAHCKAIEISGRTPGVNYSVKMRAIGNNGPGLWSAVCTLMAL